MWLGPNLFGKAPNWHHDPDDFVIGGYGLKLSIVIPVFNELSLLPIILNIASAGVLWQRSRYFPY
jgi:hypothetical protein